VFCRNLKTGLGNAIVDTGSQVSLVRKCGLVKGSDVKGQVYKIHGITCDYLVAIGQINLRIGETSPHMLLVVNS